jgi:NADH-quinone oxidoreductase subunit H
MPEFDLLTTAIIIAGLVAIVMSVVGYATLAERKVSAWIQDRVGPNRVGPFGLLQPLADGGKFFLKESPIPSHVDKVFYLLAPAAAMAIALLALAVVPWGGTTPPPKPVAVERAADGKTPDYSKAVQEYDAKQTEYRGQFQGMIAPGLDIGIVYVFALGSLAIYGIILGGWSSDNKYSLLGSLRSSAQIISYEIPLGMSIVGVVLFSGSMNLETIIAWQKQNGWFFAFQPLAFLLFMVSVYAECNRLPFDLPEAEQELVGGYLTEYGSLKFGMFMLGEYTHMITTSFLMSIVFWGGWSLFGLEDSFADPIAAAVLKAAILAAKMFGFLLLYLLVRWTIPRFRFDQLMTLAWKVMIPLSLVHLLAAMLVRQYGLSMWVLTGISVGLFVAVGVIAAFKNSAPNNAPRRKVPAVMLPRVM